MLVYLVRHAIAEERDPLDGGADFSRRLTDRGIERMNRNVAALAALDVSLSEIWTSPLVRAKQTAELLVPLLVRRRAPETLDELSPGGNLAALRERLDQAIGAKAIALVGHEPDMGELGSTLIFGAPHGGMAFKKGGVACIEMPGGPQPAGAVLRWMLTPKQMSSMKQSLKA